MAANKRIVAIIASLMLGIGALARAESLVIPPDTWVFPPESAGPSSYELSFALAANQATPTQLYFDGSIENPSFFNSQVISFWFDWTGSDGTTHASKPDSFTLDPHMGIWFNHPNA